MNFAPLILFVYKRPDHLQQTLSHLKINEGAIETILYIFSEGPKSDASSADLIAIHNVRKIIHEITGFKEVIIHEAPTNIGCADSMVAGISKVLTEHESAIILEDDIVTHSLFLKFCNTGLQHFKNDDEVMQIGAFMFPADSKLPETFLSKKVFCWGWATWRRAWNELNRDTVALAQQIANRNLENDFDLEGSYPYLKSLEAQSRGQIDAWDICWYASIFLKGGRSLYPTSALTQNIGLDGSGTHYIGETGNKVLPFKANTGILRSIINAEKLDHSQERTINKAVSNWSNTSIITLVKIKINNILKRWHFIL